MNENNKDKKVNVIGKSIISSIYSFGDLELPISEDTAPIVTIDGTEYKLVKHLGGGGNAIVFMAEYEDYGMPLQVLLKFLQPSRFRLELAKAKIDSTLIGENINDYVLDLGFLIKEQSDTHPAIAYLLDSFRSFKDGFQNHMILSSRRNFGRIAPVWKAYPRDNPVVIAMPITDGDTLLNKRHELTNLSMILSVLCETAASLEAWHVNNYLHLDISPDNIIIYNDSKMVRESSSEVRAFLIDYNSSYNFNKSQKNYTFTEKVGYTAPLPHVVEKSKLAGNLHLDLYSLCAVLFWAVFGEAPIDGNTRLFSSDVQYYLARMAGSINEQELFKGHRAGLGKRIIEILSKGLSADPHKRYQTLEDLYEDLIKAKQWADPITVVKDVTEVRVRAIRGTSAKTVINNYIETYFGTADKRVAYGGRAEHENHLREWLNNSEKPLALLTTEAGRGKSALLVNWYLETLVERKDIHSIFVPISLRDNFTSEAGIFDYIFNRTAGVMADCGLDTSGFAEKYSSEIRGVNVQEGIREMLSALNEAGHKVLLIIDGIDESENDIDWAGFVDTLYRIDSNQHIKTCLSARYAGVTNCGIKWAAELNLVDKQYTALPSLKKLSYRAIKEILDGTPDPENILKDVQLVSSELYKISLEGEPLLVRLYLEALMGQDEQGKVLSVSDLQDIKPGYEGYFKHWLKPIENEDDIEDLSYILFALAHSKAPMSRSDLKRFLRFLTRGKLKFQKLIVKIKRLLYRGDKSSFTLCHPALAIYLKSLDPIDDIDFLDLSVSKAVKIGYLKWFQYVYDTIEEMDYADYPIYLKDSIINHVIEYHQENPNSAVDFYAPFITEKCVRIYNRKDGHYFNLKKVLSACYDYYLGVAGLNHYDMSHKFYISLILLSLLNSYFNDWQSENLVKLYEAVLRQSDRLGLDEDRIVSRIRMHNNQHQSEAIKAIAPFVSQDTILQLITVAMDISDEKLKSETLTFIAEAAKENSDLQLEVLKAANTLTRYKTKKSVYASVISSCAGDPEVLSRSLHFYDEITDTKEKLMILASIVRSSKGDYSLLHRALVDVENLMYKDLESDYYLERRWVLEEIVKKCNGDSGLLRKIMELSINCPEYYEKFALEFFVIIIDAIADDTDLLQQAIEFARGVEESSLETVEFLLALYRANTNTDKFLREAQQEAQNMKDGYEKSKALIAVALCKGEDSVLYKEALTASAKTGNVSTTIDTLILVTEAMGADERLLSIAMGFTKKLSTDYRKAKAIQAIVQVCEGDEVILLEALVNAMDFTSSKHRAEVFKAVIENIHENTDIVYRVVSLVDHIESESDRSEVLSSIIENNRGNKNVITKVLKAIDRMDFSQGVAFALADIISASDNDIGILKDALRILGNKQFYKAVLLITMTDNSEGNTDVKRLVLEASDDMIPSEKIEVLLRVYKMHNHDMSLLEKAMLIASGIPDDELKAKSLKQIISSCQSNSEILSRVRAIADNISNDQERMGVLIKLIACGGGSRNHLLSVLNIADGFGVDFSCLKAKSFIALAKCRDEGDYWIKQSLCLFKSIKKQAAQNEVIMLMNESNILDEDRVRLLLEDYESSGSYDSARLVLSIANTLGDYKLLRHVYQSSKDILNGNEKAEILVQISELSGGDLGILSEVLDSVSELSFLTGVRARVLESVCLAGQGNTSMLYRVLGLADEMLYDSKAQVLEAITVSNRGDMRLYSLLLKSSKDLISSKKKNRLISLIKKESEGDLGAESTPYVSEEEPWVGALNQMRRQVLEAIEERWNNFDNHVDFLLGVCGNSEGDIDLLQRVLALTQNLSEDSEKIMVLRAVAKANMGDKEVFRELLMLSNNIINEKSRYRLIEYINSMWKKYSGGTNNLPSFGYKIDGCTDFPYKGVREENGYTLSYDYFKDCDFSYEEGLDLYIGIASNNKWFSVLQIMEVLSVDKWFSSGKHIGIAEGDTINDYTQEKERLNVFQQAKTNNGVVDCKLSVYTDMMQSMWSSKEVQDPNNIHADLQNAEYNGEPGQKHYDSDETKTDSKGAPLIHAKKTKWRFKSMGLVICIILVVASLFLSRCSMVNLSGADYFNNQDYKNAISVFQKHDDQPESQFYLGYMFMNGLGVEQDYSEAFKWYSKSADQGDPQAQYHLFGSNEDLMSKDGDCYPSFMIVGDEFKPVTCDNEVLYCYTTQNMGWHYVDLSGFEVTEDCQIDIFNSEFTNLHVMAEHEGLSVMLEDNQTYYINIPQELKSQEKDVLIYSPDPPVKLNSEGNSGEFIYPNQEIIYTYIPSKSGSYTFTLDYEEGNIIEVEVVNVKDEIIEKEKSSGLVWSLDKDMLYSITLSQVEGFPAYEFKVKAESKSYHTTSPAPSKEITIRHRTTTSSEISISMNSLTKGRPYDYKLYDNHGNLVDSYFDCILTYLIITGLDENTTYTIQLNVK